VTVEPDAGANPRVTARFVPSTDTGMTWTPFTFTVTAAGSVVVTPPLDPSTMGPL
jgi:hypothetical protein